MAARRLPSAPLRGDLTPVGPRIVPHEGCYDGSGDTMPTITRRRSLTVNDRKYWQQIAHKVLAEQIIFDGDRINVTRLQSLMAGTLYATYQRGIRDGQVN